MNFSAKVVLNLVLCFTGMSSLCAAPAPRVSNVSGTLVDKDILTIVGQNFGVKNQAPPVFFDMVDEALINGVKNDLYAALPDGDIVPQGTQYPWIRSGVSPGGAGPIRIGPSRGPYGSRARVYYGDFEGDTNRQDGWLEWPAGFPDPELGIVTELYESWYFRPSFDPSDQNGSHKFIRVWDSRTSKSVGIRVSWTQMHLTYDQKGDGTRPSWGDWGGTPNQWNKMEIYINSSTGVIKTWVNSNLIHDISDFEPGGDNSTGSFQGIQPRLWGLDGSGDANWVGENIMLSDLYADSTQARVELCDAPKWSDCAIREPQPAITWTNDEISVRINSGALPDLSNSFVYVITDSGITNWIGYPLSGVQRPDPPSQLSSD